MSQSSMSHVLAKLRTHFDDALLIPVGRKFVLTERAEMLVEAVSRAVLALQDVFTPREPFEPQTSTRTFRIAATDNLALYVLPKLAALVQTHAPQVNLRVCALGADWLASLQRGDIELKLGRKADVPEGLESEQLAVDHFACVVRRGHPATPRLSVNEYARLNHLVISPTGGSTAAPGGAIDAILQKQGVQRRIAMTVPHFLVAPFIVAQSDLALTAPVRLLTPFIQRLSLRRLVLPFQVPKYALSQVWATRSNGDAGHRWLRSLLAQTLFD